jgi:hypothetical protein
VLAGVNAAWCVVGGWAIDLWLGEITRPHEDLEIAIPRDDFPAVRARLHDYALFSVGDGEVWRLADGEEHAPDKHQTWVLDAAADRWRLDVMLEPGDADRWVFRRDPSITLPRADTFGMRDDIPYLLPHCALLFKAKHMRPKDEADFECCLPRLDAWQREWLRDAVTRAHGEHPWISRLTNAGV